MSSKEEVTPKNQNKMTSSSSRGNSPNNIERSTSKKCYAELIKLRPELGKPHNSCVDATLTDFYQVTMAYAYWKAGKHTQRAVFDCYFRKNPFHGEYTIAAGIGEVIRFLNTFGYSEQQCNYMQKQMPHADPAFFEYLQSVTSEEVTVHAMREGEVVFPSQPILQLEGPLAICQLMETTILNLVNYPSLMATNASRYRILADQFYREGMAKSPPVLLEFGTRRAQGSDGAMSASRYSYLGGFDGTSNVKAGHVFDIPIKGTHAHAYVTSFESLKDVPQDVQGESSLGQDFVNRVLQLRERVPDAATSKDGELAAFITYAMASPAGFLALVDTYDTLYSGVPNFLCVALALLEAGYTPIGLRLDSGDLAYLSQMCRERMSQIESMCLIDAKFNEKIRAFKICASNDINERVLQALNDQGHCIDIFGIGTNLVTCQAQPALGMVYKLVELDGVPRIKLSEEMEKVSIPCRKVVYRLYNKEKRPILDLIQRPDEPEPKAGERIFCRHPWIETKRCYVVPSSVEKLLHRVWGTDCFEGDDMDRYKWFQLETARTYSQDRLKSLRGDHKRNTNPTPYMRSMSDSFYKFFHAMWHESMPIRELS